MTEQKQQKPLNTHLVLSIVSLCLTPLLGFFALPAAIAALLFALKAENDLTENNVQAARAAARYAGIFGWIAIALFAIPWIAGLIIIFLVFGAGLMIL